MKKNSHDLWCHPCKYGESIGAPKTFTPTCPRCQWKKAQGMRTGNEPPPEQRYGKARLTQEQMDRNAARLRRAAKNRAKAFAEYVPLRHQRGI